MPLTRPALAFVAITTFQGAWEDFQGPLLYLRNEALYTVLSSRLVGGRPVIHVHSASDPGDGFAPVAPDLEDVYFQRLRLQARARAA